MGILDRLKNADPAKAPARTAGKASVGAAKSTGEKSEKSLADVRKQEGKADLNKPLAERKLKDSTGDAYKILLRAVITEKSAFLADKGQYVFEVSSRANKVEVSKAVKNVYGVTPVRINMIKLPGKVMQIKAKNTEGRRKDKFKAIVTLKKGEKIPLFDGV